LIKNDEKLKNDNLLEIYVNKYKSNFIKLCKDYNIYPNIRDLKAFSRTGNPVG
jgi:hypothetical protein